MANEGNSSRRDEILEALFSRGGIFGPSGPVVEGAVLRTLGVPVPAENGGGQDEGVDGVCTSGALTIAF